MSKTEEVSQGMPAFEVVRKYAEGSVEFYLNKHAKHVPEEQQDEMRQDAMVRVWDAYQRLVPDRGWKSFIQLHCRGAVLDYLNSGDGAIEDGSVANPESNGLRKRVEIFSEEGTPLEVEEIAALFGIFKGDEEEDVSIAPNWDLVSRLVCESEDLHIIAKILLGFTQEQIAEQLTTQLGKTVSRERVSQRIYEFFVRLDEPVKLTDRKTNQMIYALGLCRYYHMPEVDNGYGHDLPAFDVNDEESFRQVRCHFEPSLFDFRDKRVV